MKKNIKNIIKIFIILLFTLGLVIYFKYVINSVLDAINIFKKAVFPSLFSFFVISDLLINYGFIDNISNIFKNIIYKLFKIKKECSFVIFMSMLCGCPSSGKYIKSLLNQNIINTKEASYLLSFTHFVNPMFILGTINTFINNKKICFIIMISHYLSNLIIGLTIKNKEYNYNKKYIIKEKETLPLGKCLTTSINNNINILINILGTIIVFFIITTIINNFININYLYKVLINGIFEITQGISLISTINIPLILKSSIISFFISFGGLCIHMQVFNILNEYNINYYNYLLSRITSGLLSFIICYSIIYVFL